MSAIALLSGYVLTKIAEGAAWVGTAALSGVIGNRMDKSILTLKDNTIELLQWKSPRLPENHDLLKALRLSLLSATKLGFKSIASANGSHEALTASFKWIDRQKNDINGLESWMQHETPSISQLEHFFGSDTDYTRFPDKLQQAISASWASYLQQHLILTPEMENVIFTGWYLEGRQVKWLDAVVLSFSQILKNPADKIGQRARIALEMNFLADIKKELTGMSNSMAKIEVTTEKILQHLEDEVPYHELLLRRLIDIDSKLDDIAGAVHQILFAVEKKEQNNITMSTLTDENILKVLNLFTSGTKRMLTDEELANAYDTKVKLNQLIFQEFDEQSKTCYKDKLSGVIFDRLLVLDLLTSTDLDSIHNIRSNTAIYSYTDRALIVSGLTLSLFNQFDPAKAHLLLDFVSDFEEKVWKRALTGLILNLIKYENFLSGQPSILRRLGEFKENSSIQTGIMNIERILSEKMYSMKDLPPERYNGLVNLAKKAIGISTVVIDRQIFDSFETVGKKTSKSLDEIMFHALLNEEGLHKLKDRLGNEESVTISIEELYELINFPQYLQLYELNPMHLDFRDPFYQAPKNWFIPFKRTAEMDELIRRTFPGDSVDVEEFIQLIENLESMNSIDKHGLIYSLSDSTDESIEMIFYLLRDLKYYSLQTFENPDEIEYGLCIKELYRFQSLFINNQSGRPFEKNLDIYNKSLLQKISDKETSDKIKARRLYMHEEYEKSLEILLLMSYEKNLEILEIIVQNYLRLEKYEEAATYIAPAIAALKDKGASMTERLKWVHLFIVIYENAGRKKEYCECLLTEVLLLENQLNDAIINKEYIQGLIDKTSLLVNSYQTLSVEFCNEKKEYNVSLFYLIRILNLIYFVRGLYDAVFLEKYARQKESFKVVLSNLFSDNPSFAKDMGMFQRLNPAIFNPVLFDQLQKFVDALLDIDRIRLETDLSGYDNYQELILPKRDHIYEEILPAIKNIKEKTAGVENVVVPFMTEQLRANITVNIQNLFDKGAASFESDWLSSLLPEFASQEMEIVSMSFFESIHDQTLPSFSYNSAGLRSKIAAFFLDSFIPAPTGTNDGTLPAKEIE